MHVLNSLVPVFLVIALGAALKRADFMTLGELRALNRLTYWVGLPCLLFHEIASARFQGGVAGQVLAVLLPGTLGALVLALLLAWALRLPRTSGGAFVQAAFRGNLAFVGLPVIVYVLSGQGDSDVAAVAILALAPMAPIYNILAVLVLIPGQVRPEGSVLRRIIQPVVTNPIVIGSVAGIVASLLRVRLPELLDRTLMVIGQMALPLALVSIGGTLATVQMRGSLTLAAAAATLKVVVAPALGYLTAVTFDIGAMPTKIALIYLACPAAASSFVLADQMGSDYGMAAAAVVLSTLLAMLSLGVIVALI